MAKKPVIIDCDPGIDDVMMLLLGLRHEDIDVKLITTSAGNQTQEKVVTNALRFVSYLDHNIEITRGSEKPFIRDLMIAGDIHGESGLGGVTFPESTLKESEQPAIQAMVNVLREADEPVTIVATGPMTNVGALLLAHPELKHKIKQISIMGGAVLGGNVTPQAEFNIYVDPEAAEVVMQSGLPIIMSGLDVTHKAYLTQSEVAAMKEIGTPLTDKLHGMLAHYMDAQGDSPFLESYHGDVLRLHDLCAMAYVIDPTLFEGDDYYVTVETCGNETAGATVVDHLRNTDHEPNVHVLYDVERERFVELFFEYLRG
ncbi:nucleoside hydrolase [Alkalibacillus almallahensis]|uniref:nucleoside hydrolase n=1 Tax=Alkalibacillus almallahensis TaxID=1379154 RepID=UPI0014204CDE|nr:nucleoside hydrolase [Alkalibacillus almallahensis]NIK12442.1 pyrimidine-specific ribonucleoside hydrolase [Alkalibacillus almallahensis]